MISQTLTKEEAIAQLDELQRHDIEMEHIAADDILLSRLRALGEHEVVNAYQEANDRVGFWYS